MRRRTSITLVVTVISVSLLVALGLARTRSAEPRLAAVAVPTAAPVPVEDRTLAAWPGTGGDPVRDEIVYQQEYQAREAVIRRCMRGHGYAYVPIPLLTGLPTSTTRPVDPNARVVAALAEDERVAYNMALAGVPDANDPGAEVDVEAPGQGGCIGTAHQDLPGLFRLPPELQNAVIETRRTAESAPAVRAASARWRDCVLEGLPADRRPITVETPGDLRRLADLGLRGVDGGRQTVDQMVTRGDSCRGDLDAAYALALSAAEADFVTRHLESLEAHREGLVDDHQRLGVPTDLIE